MDGLRDLTNYWEIDVSVGANQFLGDLGGNKGIGRDGLKDYMFDVNRILAGASCTYNINNYSAVNLGINFAMITGADSLINNTGDMERWRYWRNLSFKSNVIEATGTYTWYPIMHLYHNRMELFRFNPYISAGLGVMHFNPKANLDGHWYALQPLRLEGEGFQEYPDRKPYARTVLFIPINVGVKYYFNNRFGLSAGWMIRKTFTDYMDDISTTYIDPTLFDKYFTPEKAAVAKQLYARSRKPEKVRPDILKADNTDKDSYTTFYLRLSIRLDKKLYIYYPKL
ncbi:hypothetical protein FRZ67_01320 [Panacibacter ginsenosidivorans]|uniref:Outer membrane beta-barrel protein n=1 Tax=Panacibacter ginsenosidivorans TaxID=1813871 RepID=A0A5B8V4A5_9BACT|nr:hypothetical protein [Panacibacter ginsenosidivorans]QEC66008.1 hypothetical protein FRZ67_01320 [Panacibacter ginsenosidivorans]